MSTPCGDSQCALRPVTARERNSPSAFAVVKLQPHAALQTANFNEVHELPLMPARWEWIDDSGEKIDALATGNARVSGDQEAWARFGRRTALQGKSKKTLIKPLTLPFDTSFGHLIRSIHRSQAQLLRARLSQDGVSIGCWYFLRVLWDEDMITQRELSLRTMVNEATTRSAVDRMESEKLVNRINDPKDRRKRYVRLTTRALELKPELISFAENLNNQILAILPKVKQRELLLHLSQVYEHIKGMPIDVDGESEMDSLT